MSWQFVTDEFDINFKTFEVSIHIRETSENKYAVSLKSPKTAHEIEIQTPYKTQNMVDRRKQYVAELALIEWLQFLED